MINCVKQIMQALNSRLGYYPEGDFKLFGFPA